MQKVALGDRKVRAGDGGASRHTLETRQRDLELSCRFGERGLRPIRRQRSGGNGCKGGRNGVGVKEIEDGGKRMGIRKRGETRTQMRRMNDGVDSGGMRKFFEKAVVDRAIAKDDR